MAVIQLLTIIVVFVGVFEYGQAKECYCISYDEKGHLTNKEAETKACCATVTAVDPKLNYAFNTNHKGACNAEAPNVDAWETCCDPKKLDEIEGSCYAHAASPFKI